MRSILFVWIISVLFLWWCEMQIINNEEPLENQNSESVYAEEMEVLSRYEEMEQAMVDKDIEKLDEIVKDWTVFTHMSWKTQTKQEYFSDIKSWKLDYQAYSIENPEVTIDWDKATIRARVSLTANAYWAQWTWPFNVTAHFEKVDWVWLYTN